MYKLSPFVTAALLLIITLFLFRRLGSKSGYVLSPSPISVGTKSTASLFDLPYKMECVPGPTEEASYYTLGLTPGGSCGASDLVNAQANYTITGGIGGSLMDQ